MIRPALLLVLLAALCQVPCSAYGAEEANPAPAAPAANPLPEITVDAAAWKPLFTTPDFAGWRQPVGEWQMVGEVAKDPANEKALVAKPGTGIIYNSPKGHTKDLVTADEFGDIALHVEFMIPKGSNSGIYFMSRYEIQVYDSYGVEKDAYPGIECGGVYERWDPARGKGKEGFEGHSPRVNASKAPGEWQTFDVIFRATRFDANGKKTANAKFVKVVHNGVVIHENVELTGPTRGAISEQEKATGPLRLQGDHGPVAYRNVRIVPLAQ
ncbi:MAG: DUF1080 domain-containing protein [Planctomycetota bacterium]|nr:DUF1080 domain-containing protein [Planctomycetota bacterium]